MPETAPPGPVVRHVYGAHPSQVTDLHLPPADSVGGAAPVCVVIHGGFWRARYGMELGTPLAADLAGHGVAALNVEYRRIGDGGGWPRTCEDVASAVDALAELDATVVGRLDLSRVVALGHSAGGHLAGWLAGRPALPVGAPGSDPRVRLTGAVLQAPSHPYTRGLMQSVPRLGGRSARLQQMDGAMPRLKAIPPVQRTRPQCRIPLQIRDGLSSYCLTYFLHERIS